jgi:hypothetical protein
MSERHWNSELQQWVHDDDLYKALDAAQLAILEYHNGDRSWAEAWLIRAQQANSGDRKSGA